MNEMSSSCASLDETLSAAATLTGADFEFTCDTCDTDNCNAIGGDSANANDTTSDGTDTDGTGEAAKLACGAVIVSLAASGLS